MFLIDKNLNPSVETKPDPRSIEGLTAWLETQDGETEYPFWDCEGGCLIGQYQRASSGHSEEIWLRLHIGKMRAAALAALKSTTPQTGSQE